MPEPRAILLRAVLCATLLSVLSGCRSTPAGDETCPVTGGHGSTLATISSRAGSTNQTPIIDATAHSVSILYRWSSTTPKLIFPDGGGTLAVLTEGTQPTFSPKTHSLMGVDRLDYSKQWKRLTIKTGRSFMITDTGPFEINTC
jgi:hypothetical protein